MCRPFGPLIWLCADPALTRGAIACRRFAPQLADCQPSGRDGDGAWSSAEGAALNSRRYMGCAGPSGLSSGCVLTPRWRAGLFPAGASRLSLPCGNRWTPSSACALQNEKTSGRGN